jgi:spore germination protein KC
VLSNNNFALFIISFMAVFLLAGCWDSEEIDDRAVVLAISLDKENQQKGESEIAYTKSAFSKPSEKLMRLSAQIAVPGRIPLGPETGGGTGNEKPVWVVSVTGHTVDEAMLNLQQRVADPLFLGHLRIIVISEDLAHQGVNQFVDYLKRNSEVRRTAWMVVSKGNAAKYMKIAPKLERVPALYLSTIMDNSVSLGKFPMDVIGLFWSILSSNAQDPYLPYLDVKNKENVIIKGLAYFTGDKMTGTINPLQTGFFMALIGYTKGGYGTYIKIPELNENILVKVSRRHARIKTSLKNGHPHIRIFYHYEADIDQRKEAFRQKPLDSRLIKKIEKKFDEGVKEAVLTLIKQAQKRDSDIFGFGNHFRAKQPNYWEHKVKTFENWHKEFKELTVEVISETRIRRVGMKAE